MSLIYCYGVVEESPKLEKQGFESNKTYLITFKDISAVVSDVSEESFSQEEIDKNIKNMKWLTAHAQVHENVVDFVMKTTTIIPMKFCTVFKTKEKVESMLESNYADLKYNLNNLKGKVEMGVKVYFDTTQLNEKIRGEDKEIKELGKKAEGKSPGAAYFEKQKINVLLKAKVQKKLSKNAREIFNRTKEMSEESKQNELLNKKLTGKEMLLNAVFLIYKKDLEKFNNNINEIKADYPDMEFKIWGPFPPYNFVK